MIELICFFSGLGIGATAALVWEKRTDNALLSMHENVVTRVLASEKVMRLDPTRPKPAPLPQKTEFQLALDEQAELKRQENAFFGKD